jgi:hypothetical protein
LLWRPSGFRTHDFLIAVTTYSHYMY